jgi:hypothetical protein
MTTALAVTLVVVAVPVVGLLCLIGAVVAAVLAVHRDGPDA